MNTKISQLPNYTGDTTGVWLVMNDSGQTTTYRVNKSVLIGAAGSSGTSGSSGSSGTSGSSGSSGTSGSSGSSGTSGSSGSSGSSGTSGSSGSSGTSGTSGQAGSSGSSGTSGTSGSSGTSGQAGSSGSSGTSGTSGSSGSSGTSGDSFFQSGTGFNSVINIYQASGDTTQDYSVLIGGFDNTISGSNSGSTIVGGYNNDIVNGGSYSGIFAGHEHGIGSGGGHHGILAGQNSQINGEYNCAIVGGINNTIGWGENMLIAGCSNVSFGGGGGANSAIIASQAVSLSNFAQKRVIMASEASGGNGDSRGSLIFATYQADINANSEFVSIGASAQCNVNGFYPSASVIFASQSCDIDNTGQNQNTNNAIIGSFGSDIVYTRESIGQVGMYSSKDSIISGGSEQSVVIGSNDGRILAYTGYQNTIIGSNDTDILVNGEGYNNTIIGSFNSDIKGTDDIFYNTIIGSSNSFVENNVDSAARNIILNSDFGSISGNTEMIYNTIITANDGLIKGDVDFSVMLNVNNGDINSLGADNRFNTIISSENALITGNTADYNTIIGVGSSAIKTGSGPFNLLLNGFGLEIVNTNLGGCNLIGGFTNKVNSADEVSIIGGARNTISGNTDTAGLFVSKDTAVGGTPFFVGLGLNTRTITSDFDATTAVENLYSFRQMYGATKDNLSGNTIDFENGNIQKVSLTANTALTFSNVKNGAQYTLVVENTGSFNITGATASGFTIKCEGAALPNITNNGTDICVLAVIGDVIYVRHFANFDTP